MLDAQLRNLQRALFATLGEGSPVIAVVVVAVIGRFLIIWLLLLLFVLV